MIPQITIHKASPEDTETIAAFQVAMARETENLTLDPSTVIAGVQRMFSEPERGFYLVARNDGNEMIGCLLVLSEWSDWRNTEVWWVHSVYVIPKYRGRGVFSRLFRHVERLGAESGAAGIRLYVEIENKKAKKVYERLGMTNQHYELYEKMLG